MKRTKLAALLLSGVMAASVLAGCGGVDKEAVVATFDEQEITLGVSNFAARLQQAYQEDMYTYYFGDNVWEQDFSGTGTTVEEDLKSSVMDTMFELYTLQAHMADYDVELSETEKAAAAEAAVAFLEANSGEVLEELGADQTIVEEYLKLLTIQAKMQQAIKEAADISVSDEEANTGTYSYVTISKSSTAADDSSDDAAEEEQDMLAATVAAFATEAKVGTLEEAAEKYTYTVSNGTFTAGEESVDEEILAALNELEEGDVSDVIDTEDAYYVVRLDAKTDKAATETTRQSLLTEKEDAFYDEVLAGWQEAHTWEVDEKVWKTVAFDRAITTQKPVSTETEEATEE